MTLVGLSLLVVTIILVAYRTQPNSWSSLRAYFKSWKRRKPLEGKPRSLPSTQISSETTPTIEMTPSPPTSSSHETPQVDHLSSTTTAKPPAATTPASKVNASQLMPPPARPSSTLAPQRTTQSSTSLRVPTTGPLPNRTPTAQNTAKPRKPVILAPGHSPLDWAHLTRTSDLTGLPAHLRPPLRVTPTQLARANGRKTNPAWAAYRGKVYNIGAYLPFHPGGPGELLRAAGKGAKGEAEKLFDEIHPWVNWENMLGACFIGYLVEEKAG